MELPETLTHRVQSFLTGKEAARTTLLSKSWLAAWSTRPTIDIDEFHFPDSCNDPSQYIEIDRLTESANKTFRRYEESNLSIDTFILSLINGSYDRYGLAEQWTLKALKLGATDLTLRFPKGNIDIPLDQVFGNENVQRVCLQCSYIDGFKGIQSSRLKSLTLIGLILGTDQLLDMLSCFPLIEHLSLSDIHSRYEDRVVRSSPPTVVLRELRSLVLSRFQSLAQMKTLFLYRLPSNFPNLKHLTLEIIFPNEPDQMTQSISSGTLETLSLRYVEDINGRRDRSAELWIDVPSIRKFTYEGSQIPKMCFSPTIGQQWDSHVSISNHGDMCNKWFYELHGFLSKLEGSKIHLCLHLNFNESCDYEVGEVKGLNLCELEDLTLDTKGLPSLSCYAFLDALFRICHPKFITQYSSPHVNDDKVCPWKNGDDDGGNNDVFICRLLERAMQEKNSLLLPTQFMYGLRDLEELNVQQLFDGVWKHQPLSSILDDSTSQPRRFRFQLKWKPCLNQYMRSPDDDDGDDDDGDDDDVVEDDDEDDGHDDINIYSYV